MYTATPSARRSAAQAMALDAMTIGTTAVTLLLAACVLIHNAALLTL